jgi:hypothetical protein
LFSNEASMPNYFATFPISDKVVLLRSCGRLRQLESPKLTNKKCSLVNKWLSMEQVLQINEEKRKVAIMCCNSLLSIEIAEEAFEDCNESCCQTINTKEDPDLFNQGSLEDNYEVETVLGAGGYGVVYAGKKKKDKVKVAIKHIDKEKVTCVEMVIKEADNFKVT